MKILERFWLGVAVSLICTIVFVSGLLGHAQVSALEKSEALLELGESTFEKKCATCHGEEGLGDGEAAYLLYPKPRDFVAARYRLISTWERTPTDDDIFNTISRGMPGSAMPPWEHLSEDKRWGLVHYVKSLSERPLTIKEPTEPENEDDVGTGIVSIPPEPPYTPEAQERAAYLYDAACAGCHGATGRGDGSQKQVDEEGFATTPRDLTLGIYKGSPSADEVYRHIVAGMPGTPMPMSNWGHGDDVWHLVHFVLAMSNERQREGAVMVKSEITAGRVEKLPEHPDAREWHSATPVNASLMPLWWRNDRPESVTVRAVHDGKEIAILLVWQDNSHDHKAIRVQDFRDAAAVQFSLVADPPFFGMGEEASKVNIWMWKSDVQADIDSGFQDMESSYPRMAVDMYQHPERAPADQPQNNAPTLVSHPTFVTGWGSGNIVSDPTREKSVEDLNARGLGTLQARPMIDTAVDAKGLYRANAYRVMFRRPLRARGKEVVRLRTGTTVPVAFAVWDGRAGDRDGKKSITIWQDLKIAP